MSSRLSSIAAKPLIRNYAQGQAQSMVSSVADFIAPAVDVASLTFRYKTWSNTDRFRVPQTKRGLGGRATELRFEAGEQTAQLVPHAIDAPVDMLEQLEDTAVENWFKMQAQWAAQVGALAHEDDVISAALASAGAGTTLNVTSDTDPISTISLKVLDLMKAAKMGGFMNVRVVAGPTAELRLCNSAGVRSRFPVGQPKKSNALNPTLDDVMQLVSGKPESRTCFIGKDSSNPGGAESFDFLLSNQLLLFVSSPTPTLWDPSFMKTFRLAGQWMKPGTYLRDDGRVEVAKFDWIGLPKITNSAAVFRYNVTV